MWLLPGVLPWFCGRVIYLPKQCPNMRGFFLRVPLIRIKVIMLGSILGLKIYGNLNIRAPDSENSHITCSIYPLYVKASLGLM